MRPLSHALLFHAPLSHAPPIARAFYKRGLTLVRTRTWFAGLVCASVTDTATNSYYNATLSGQPTAGTCLPGFAASNPPPSRTCLLIGVWSNVTGTCNRKLPQMVLACTAAAAFCLTTTPTRCWG